MINTVREVALKRWVESPNGNLFDMFERLAQKEHDAGNLTKEQLLEIRQEIATLRSFAMV